MQSLSFPSSPPYHNSQISPIHSLAKIVKIATVILAAALISLGIVTLTSTALTVEASWVIIATGLFSSVVSIALHTLCKRPSYALFPHHTLSVSDLSKVAETLRSREGQAASHIYEEMVQLAATDPLIPRRTQEHEAPTHVRFSVQDFLLAPLPTKEAAVGYLRSCIEKDVRVIVSAHEYKNATVSECPRFWDPDILSQLTCEGWQMVGNIHTVLACGAVFNVDGEMPRLVETVLARHRDGRLLTHLHYYGWTDRHEAPDEGLLQKLLTRMQELSPHPRNPIAINCHAGRGRTLNIAAAYFLRKIIDDALKRGETIKNMSFNLSDIMHQFHRQRDLDLRGRPPKDYFYKLYAQILSVTAGYCQRRSP